MSPSDQRSDLELQSAYKKHHSTDSALLKVKNDILLNTDAQKVTLLVLLDLSAAFDTVCRDILLDSTFEVALRLVKLSSLKVI